MRIRKPLPSALAPRGKLLPTSWPTGRQGGEFPGHPLAARAWPSGQGHSFSQIPVSRGPAAVVQRKEATEEGVAPGLPGARRATQRAGEPLPESFRAKMERAFRRDFSLVRIHRGPEAAAIGALAFTRGPDIHIAPNRYHPASQQGESLLAHELTHVVQQGAGRVAAPSFSNRPPINADSGLEAEADQLGARAVRGEAVGPLVAGQGSAAVPAAAPAVQCQSWWELLQRGAGAVSNAASSAYQTASGVASSAYDLGTSAASTLSGAASSAAQTASGVASSAYDLGASTASTLSGAASSAYQTASGLASSAYQAGTNAASSAYQTASGLAGSAYQAGTNAASSAAQTVSGLASSAYDTVSNLSLSDVAQGVGRVGYGLYSGYQGARQLVQGNIIPAAEGLTNAVYQGLTGAAHLGVQAATPALRMGAGAISSIPTAIRTGSETIQHLRQGQYGQAAETGADFVGNALTAASPLIGMVNPAAGAAAYNYSYLGGVGTRYGINALRRGINALAPAPVGGPPVGGPPVGGPPVGGPPVGGPPVMPPGVAPAQMVGGARRRRPRRRQ